MLHIGVIKSPNQTSGNKANLQQKTGNDFIRFRRWRFICIFTIFSLLLFISVLINSVNNNRKITGRLNACVLLGNSSSGDENYKMSHKTWIHDGLNVFAIIPSSLNCIMWPNYPGSEFVVLDVSEKGQPTIHRRAFIFSKKFWIWSFHDVVLHWTDKKGSKINKAHTEPFF